MSDAGANQLNVPTDAPIDVYRTPAPTEPVELGAAIIVPAAGAPATNDPAGQVGAVGAGAPLNVG